jgi:1,4-alpha-glucan branching enzyme
VLKIQQSAKGAKVTFVLSLDQASEPVSVLGDFNGWDPLAHPLKKRTNGTRSASVEIPSGHYHFKYLAADGTWFCDPDVTETGLNEYQEMNSVFTV